MNRTCFAVLFGAVVALGCHAQDPTSRVRTGTRIVPATAVAGDTVTVEVTVDVDPGYHIYGGLERESDPTRLTFDVPDGLELDGPPTIPPGLRHEEGGIEGFWVTGRAVLKQKLKVAQAAPPGAYDVAGRVHYMACTPEFCEPPTTAPVTATLTVIGERASERTQDPPQRAPPAQGPAQQDPTRRDATGGQAPPDPGDTDPVRVDLQDLLGLETDGRITFEPRIEPNPARPGETVDLIVSVTLQDGWHVYGKKDENPIRLAATDVDPLRPRGVNRLPDGTEHRITDTLVNYWLEGGFEIRQAFAVPQTVEPGQDLRVRAKVDYLLCDPLNCDPPAAEKVELALAVEPGEPRERYLGAGFDEDFGGGLWKLILAAIGAGLFALLMPCTYPMIPITISFFTKQASVRSGGNVLPLSLAYGAGIVLIFVLIGLFAAPVIVPFATHPATNAIIAVVFLVFALVLFGFINLQPPQFLMNAASKASTKGGYIGVFLMGACLVITSFTCTVPFVGGLLALTAQGGTREVIIGMGTFGLTMAAPFVLLSLLPGRLQAMPRAGEWMNTLKVYLGFVELAAALKFVSNVDLVVNEGPRWLSYETFLWLWALIFAAAGLYLVVPPLVTRSTSVGLGRVAAAALTLVFAGYNVAGTLGTRLDVIMIAIVPPRELGDHPIVKDDFDRAVALAGEQGRLVLVNFTGFT